MAEQLATTEQEAGKPLRLRNSSPRVPVKMSEQAGRERSGEPETNVQNPQLSATSLVKVRTRDPAKRIRRHRYAAEGFGHYMSRVPSAQVACVSNKELKCYAGRSALWQGRVRHLV